MNPEVWNILDFFYSNFVLLYSILLILLYLMVLIGAGIANLRYQRRVSFADYEPLLESPFAPKISIIVPAYNESKVILSSLKALLSLVYPKYEIVVVNDGSTDNTLDLLVKNLSLVEDTRDIVYKVPCQEIKRVFKSTDPMYEKIIVVDKVNGKCKADANNGGINFASGDLIMVIDADTILDPYALLHMALPFTEDEKGELIAAGADIGIANESTFHKDRMDVVRAPKRFFPLMQTLEYLRAFVISRMGFGYMKGLMLVSGAFGVFRRGPLIACGGYDVNAIGEDLELIVTMRRYHYEHKLPHKIGYIPECLSWTEVPSSMKYFVRQRVRWGRALAYTIFKNIKMLFNPKYGKAGLLGFPYMFFFEWLAPFVELGGILYFVIMASMGLVHWDFAIALLLFVYAFSAMYSGFAVLYEALNFKRFKHKGDQLRLLLAGFFEMLFYHPIVVFSAFTGYFHYFAKRKMHWGEMKRTGFEPAKKKTSR